MPRTIPRHRKWGGAPTGAGIAAGIAVGGDQFIEMTDARTRRLHLVTDAATVAGRADGGRYVAMCGSVVLAASLITPEADYCRFCAHRRGIGSAR